MFVAYSRELHVSSCGGTAKRASANLAEAVRLFLEQASSMGTLAQILEESGYRRKGTRMEPPELVVLSDHRLTLPEKQAS